MINYIINYDNKVTIDGGAGDDLISNGYWSSSVSMNGGAGNDSIYNKCGKNISINAGTGNDLISLEAGISDKIIQYSAGDGNDTIFGFKGTDTLRISGGSYSTQVSGSDVIVTVGDGSILLKDAKDKAFVINRNVEGNTSLSPNFIKLTDDKDAITVRSNDVTVDAGAGNDSIENYHNSNVTILGNNGNDSIVNYDDGTNVLIEGGADDDKIYNEGSNVTINGGEGNDSIYSEGYNILINAGTGNDLISLRNTITRQTIEYSAGDGNDTIYGFKGTETLSIIGGAYSTQISGDDVIVTVGDGSILLKDAKGKSFVINGNIEGDNPVPLNFINLTDDNDAILNYCTDVTLDGGSGDDDLRNYGDNVSINGDSGSDFIDNFFYGRYNYDNGY